MTPLRFFLPLAAALALAAPAVAAPVTATIDDGTDSGARGPGSDMQQVRTTFDPAAGTWSVTVRFYGPMSDSDWAMVNGTIFTPSSDPQDCTLDNESFAWFRTSTKPITTTLRGAVGAYDDGRQPDGSLGQAPFTHLTRSVSDDRRELTVTGDAPRLVGRQPGCVTVTISYHGVIDALTPGAVFATKRASIALALYPPRLDLPARTLRFGLKPFAVATTGTARLSAGATTLARGGWSRGPGADVTVQLQRTTAGRRWIRQHPRGRVRLTATATPRNGDTVTRTFALRLR